jgi:LPS sulfotransferase NodH
LIATELKDAAVSLTGLSDFGPDDFGDGLDILVESLNRDAALTEKGARAARAIVRGALTSRLVSEAGFAAYPAQPDITRPVFVTGLPRTGTTFLHRLLAADPAAQGLELWLTEAPQPRPPRQDWESNLTYNFVKQGLEKHRTARPSFSGVHEMGAGQVEECWQLLRQSMRSVSFECLFYLPGYSSWLTGIDWTPVYQRHKRNLQLIGLGDTRRWVLKNPSHIFALDALLTVYPDALVVVTHRDPVVAIASMCSLAAQASDGWSSHFLGPVIGREQLALWSRGYEAFAAARSRYPATQFFDVGYNDLVTDPLGMVGQIYSRLGATPALDAMRPLTVPDSGSGPHRYSLADFGLTAGEVAAALGGASLL